jgi:hypothetical protein
MLKVGCRVEVEERKEVKIKDGWFGDCRRRSYTNELA